MTNTIIKGILLNELKKEKIMSLQDIPKCSFIEALDNELFRITLNTEGFSEDEIMDSLSTLRSNTKYHDLENGGKRMTGEISSASFAPTVQKVQFSIYRQELKNIF